ncbi:MAG: response regulator, partial [Elusimicrobia bacterium]|nr:response regulator [Elusimicrobiota bacterium]
LLGALLKHWELEVTELGSGTEALTTLASRRVDLALVDLRLPGHDGYEVIRCARSYLKLRDTVILAVSALDDPKDEVAALNLGADAFFRKPFSLQLLEARLKPFVRRLYDRLGG